MRPRLPRRPSRYWFTGLRPRLVAAFVAVALLASVIASGIAYVLVRRSMLQRAQDTALTKVREIIARTVPSRLPPDATGLLSEALSFRLTNLDEGRLAYAGPLALDGPIAVPTPVADLSRPVDETDGSRLHVPVSQEFARRAVQGMVFQRIVRQGRPYLLIGAHAGAYVTTVDEPQRTTPPIVFVSVSLEKEARELRSFTRSVLVADAASLAAALLLALAATRGVLRPVRRLGGAARALGDGDLTVRVPERGRDELADLARTFNATADALERMVTELRAMDAASRRFVADVSHELRTPLTSMLAVTDVLTEDAAATEAGGTAARLVAEETRRLGILVEHLIEISRFDAGAAALQLDDVLVGEAVAGTLAARGWTGRVTVDGPADLIARIDPRRFDVIVANLAGNALKHGAPPVRLEYGPAERDGRPGFRVAVTDHGPGLPEDLLAVVFDRFVKAEAARSRSGGSGLGLSIARENAVLHGGTLEAANAPGAVFTAWLPLEPDGPERRDR
ncbi:HAMP domain-containing sensor histidine kinase [Actinomadura kijaniata]|uniref:histidine kinase n=1 Tax=Actinomadura namibiensis TaxID=182080 RepID=A0A7W3LX01_ACTNM|nr:HAMP domain-containing sensor histidine kinase [Actinomadura namibiensis]MBA8955779.1 two-component system sensor histidine kinase MtrB [Actinomadura namibiensis]